MKEDLLLLHGWGGSAKSLTPLAKNLSELFNVHVLEMPGHGQTPEMDSPWAMKDYALWVKKYLIDNNIQNYHLLGHSFGGKIILEAVSSEILKPESIILINANGIKPKKSLKVHLLKNLSKFKFLKNILKLSFFRKIFYKIIVREKDYFSTESVIKESFKKFVEEHYDDKISSIKCKTLIIWGKDDKATPLWMGEKIHKQIGNSKLIIMNDTHGLPLHQPNNVANQILNFYSKNKWN